MNLEKGALVPDQLNSKEDIMKIATDIHQRADLVNKYANSEEHQESSDYNLAQLDVMFTPKNIAKLTEKLGHTPSELEVVQDWVQSGQAAKFSRDNGKG